MSPFRPSLEFFDEPRVTLLEFEAVTVEVLGAEEAGAIEFRRAKIQDAADRMKTIGQLRRALTLDEWKVDPINQTVNENIRQVDTELRNSAVAALTRKMRLPCSSSAMVLIVAGSISIRFQ